jgi:hypothetical protein
MHAITIGGWIGANQNDFLLICYDHLTQVRWRCTKRIPR